jgi:hypothetical protein
MTRSVPITIAAYNESMVQALLGPLRVFVHAGDEVDLVSGNHDRPLSIPTLDGWVDQLVLAVPEGVRFSAHTSGLDNATTIAAQASPKIESVLLDYEPNWDPEFTWDFAETLIHLDRFTQVCRSRGRSAIAYPTGRPIKEVALQRYRWDYGEMEGHVDEVYPQTQHWSTLDSATWASALEILRSQRRNHALSPTDLVAQLTIGDRENGLAAAPAAQRFREARTGGLGRLFLWWAPTLVGEVQQFLQALET